MEYDPTAIVSTSSRTPPSAHHPSIHPPTHPEYTSTFGLLGTQGNVPLGTTIDLSFTERGHVANFFTNSVPLVTRPFFLPFEWPGLVPCQLAASQWLTWAYYNWPLTTTEWVWLVPILASTQLQFHSVCILRTAELTWNGLFHLESCHTLERSCWVLFPPRNIVKLLEWAWQGLFHRGMYSEILFQPLVRLVLFIYLFIYLFNLFIEFVWGPIQVINIKKIWVRAKNKLVQ